MCITGYCEKQQISIYFREYYNFIVRVDNDYFLLVLYLGLNTKILIGLRLGVF